MKETFHCKKLNNEISIGKCIRNQKEAIEFFGPDAAKYQSCPCDRGEEMKQMERKCDDCGRTLYSGRICSICKRNKQEILDTTKIGEPENSGKQPVKADDSGKEPVKPAAQRKKKKTSPKIAECKNCGRVMPHVGKGYCGGCYAVVRVAPKEELEAALAEAKERFQGVGTPIVGTRRQSRKTQEADRALHTGEEVSRTEDIISPVSSPAPPHPPANDDPKVIGIVIPIVTPADFSAYEFINDQADKNRRTIPQQILWMIECNQTNYEEVKGNEM